VADLIEQDVLDVAAADAAVCWGPGLRWGVMGPNLLCHLGGGTGGIQRFMERPPAPMARWWKDLGKPEFTEKLKQTIIDGTLEQAGDRSVEQLAREGDEMVLGLIRLRRKATQAPASQAHVRASRNHNRAPGKS
jgi:hypothetical protein